MSTKQALPEKITNTDIARNMSCVSNDLEVTGLDSIPVDQLAKDIKIIKETINSFRDQYILEHVLGWKRERSFSSPLMPPFSQPALPESHSFRTMLFKVASFNPEKVEIPQYSTKRAELQKRKEVLELQMKHRGESAVSFGGADYTIEHTALLEEINMNNFQIECRVKEGVNKVDDILSLFAIRSTECSGVLLAVTQDDRISSGNVLSQWQQELRNRARHMGMTGGVGGAKVQG